METKVPVTNFMKLSNDFFISRLLPFIILLLIFEVNYY